MIIEGNAVYLNKSTSSKVTRLKGYAVIIFLVAISIYFFYVSILVINQSIIPLIIFTILYLSIGLMVFYSKPTPLIMTVEKDSLHCIFRKKIEKSFLKNQIDEIILRSVGPSAPWLRHIIFKSNKKTLFVLRLSGSFDPSKSEVLSVLELLQSNGYKITNWP